MSCRKDEKQQKRPELADFFKKKDYEFLSEIANTRQKKFLDHTYDEDKTSYYIERLFDGE